MDEDEERFDKAFELEVLFARYRKMLIVEFITSALNKDATPEERLQTERRISYLQFLTNAISNALNSRN